MVYPDNLKYNKEHLWVKVEGDNAFIGISDYAQEKLGEILFVEMPEVGDVLELNREFAVVEASKKASTLSAPLSGEVLDINEKLDDEPEYINEQPYDAWIVKVRISNESDLVSLVDSVAYQADLV